MVQEVITIQNFEKFTGQEVFDYVVSKIFGQGEPAFDNERGICCYRLGDLKCAAGHLIPDSMYSLHLESFDWLKLVALKRVPDAHCQLIKQLQSTHDTVAINFSGELFLKKFDYWCGDLARDNNLTYVRKYED
jgi:hypothetical protein